MRSNRSNLRSHKETIQGIGKKNWAICSLESKHTHAIHRDLISFIVDDTI